MTELIVSMQSHTWLIDVDGTILKHNGHKFGNEEILPGVKDLWKLIPKNDVIILLSARTQGEMKETLKLLNINQLRYNKAIFGLPKGERILINDQKPGGLLTAIAINIQRDVGLKGLNLQIDEFL
jgi:hypothetical protein